MQSAICEELIKEDTFNLYRQQLLDFMQTDDSKTLKDIKDKLKTFFTAKILECKHDSLVYHESLRMIMILEKLVDKFDAVFNDHTEDDNDRIVKMYCESLNEFVKNVTDPDVINYVNSINQ